MHRALPLASPTATTASASLNSDFGTLLETTRRSLPGALSMCVLREVSAPNLERLSDDQVRAIGQLLRKTGGNVTLDLDGNLDAQCLSDALQRLSEQLAEAEQLAPPRVSVSVTGGSDGRGRLILEPDATGVDGLLVGAVAEAHGRRANPYRHDVIANMRGVPWGTSYPGLTRLDLLVPGHEIVFGMMVLTPDALPALTELKLTLQSTREPLPADQHLPERFMDFVHLQTLGLAGPWQTPFRAWGHLAGLSALRSLTVNGLASSTNLGAVMPALGSRLTELNVLYDHDPGFMWYDEWNQLRQLQVLRYNINVNFAPIGEFRGLPHLRELYIKFSRGMNHFWVRDMPALRLIDIQLIDFTADDLWDLETYDEVVELDLPQSIMKMLARYMGGDEGVFPGSDLPSLTRVSLTFREGGRYEVSPGDDGRWVPVGAL